MIWIVAIGIALVLLLRSNGGSETLAPKGKREGEGVPLGLPMGETMDATVNSVPRQPFGISTTFGDGARNPGVDVPVTPTGVNFQRSSTNRDTTAIASVTFDRDTNVPVGSGFGSTTKSDRVVPPPATSGRRIPGPVTR